MAGAVRASRPALRSLGWESKSDAGRHQEDDRQQHAAASHAQAAAVPKLIRHILTTSANLLSNDVGGRRRAEVERSHIVERTLAP
jgi:hypothetical protein